MVLGLLIGILGIGALFFYCLLFYGMLPPLRAHKLSMENIEAIKNNGIMHKTTKKGIDGILKERRVRGYRGINAYSNQYRKCAFFLICDGLNARSEQYNDSFKYSHIIRIHNITDEQIKKMKIRNHDQALLVCGNFDIEEENIVQVTEIEGANSEKIKKTLKALWEVNTGIAVIYQVIAFIPAIIATILTILVFIVLYSFGTVIFHL